MTYKGLVQNGVVVFKTRVRPKEGTRVEVRPVDKARSNGKPPRRGSPAAVLRHAGTWQGEAGEMVRLLAELKRMKQAEADAQRAAMLDGTPGQPDRPRRRQKP